MNEMVRFQEPRLPFHDAIEDRFGVDKSGWKALTEAVFPAAKTADSIVMALSYCKARKLDIFKRPVHIVPMWNAAKREMVETVWPGISELRTTAFRTGQCAGMDAAVFGPLTTQTFEGSQGSDSRKVTVTFPEWCQITVYRMLGGQRCQFVGPIVYWTEAYARWKNVAVPNDMWAKRPYGQHEKCAEAAAWRRAFPEEIGNDYAAEEMDGQSFAPDLEADTIPKRVAPSPSAPMIEHQANHAPAGPETVKPAEPQVPRRAPSASSAPTSQQKPPAATAYDPEKVRAHFAEALKAAKSQDDINAAWETIVDPIQDGMLPPDREDLERMIRLREAELGGEEGAQP